MDIDTQLIHESTTEKQKDVNSACGFTIDFLSLLQHFISLTLERCKGFKGELKEKVSSGKNKSLKTSVESYLRERR